MNSRKELLAANVIDYERELVALDATGTVIDSFKNVSHVNTFEYPDGKVVTQPVSSRLDAIRFAEGIHQLADRISTKTDLADEILSAAGGITLRFVVASAARSLAQFWVMPAAEALLVPALNGAPADAFVTRVLLGAGSAASRFVSEDGYDQTEELAESTRAAVSALDGIEDDVLREFVRDALNVAAAAIRDAAQHHADGWAEQLTDLATTAVMRHDLTS